MELFQMKGFHIFCICTLIRYLEPYFPLDIIMLIGEIIYRNPLRITCGYYTTIITNIKSQIHNNYLDIVPQDMEIIGCGYQYVIASMHNSNKIYVWGSNQQGQLGLGYVSRNVDKGTSILNTTYLIRSISCGDSHTFVLTTNISECYGWGSNQQGQLGLGDFTPYITSPRKLLWTNVLDISCGDMHSLILYRSGIVMSCGANNYGQLGIFSNEDKSRVPLVILGGINVISISCGRFHSVAVTENGFYVWGSNTCGQLGLGIINSHRPPRELCLGGKETIISAKCGAFYTIALTIDGAVYVWGSNSEGQLGLGNNIRQQHTPIKLRWLEPIISICCGSYHSVMVTKSNEIYAWGSNSYGQLGLSGLKNRFRPCKIKS